MIFKMYPNILPPTSYQGGKIRIAPQILENIKIPDGAMFYDLCCGSGAVSLCLISNGFDPSRIVMVDSGPYGMFWQAVSQGNFDLSVFRSHLDQIPKDPFQIPGYLKSLSSRLCDNTSAPYVFLLLQAGAFGGKSIRLEDGQWKNTSFRSYWQPKPGCNRKSVVNPMMPMPETLYNRVKIILRSTRGIKAFYQQISDVQIENNSIVYIDPPYGSTTGYLTDNVNFVQYAQSLNVPCYVSESVPLSEDIVLISEGRRKGNINGAVRKTSVSEYLSRFHVG